MRYLIKFMKRVWFYYITTPKKYRQYICFTQPAPSKKDMEWARQRVKEYKKRKAEEMKNEAK